MVNKFAGDGGTSLKRKKGKKKEKEEKKRNENKEEMVDNEEISKKKNGILFGMPSEVTALTNHPVDTICRSSA